MRSIENVVRAILREAGIKLGAPSRTAFADRVRELASADAYSASTAPLRYGEPGLRNDGLSRLGRPAGMA